MDNGQPTRRVVLGGAAAMTFPGGLPSQRRDQLLQPLTRAGSGPAPQTNLFTVILVAGSGGFVGVFLYNPTPGAGNLATSDSAAGGVDPYGNRYLAGLVSYQIGGSPLFATQVNQAQVAFYTAASQAGPWTLTGAIGNDASDNININPSGTGVVQAGSSVHSKGLFVSPSGAPVSTSATELQGGAAQTVCELIPDVSTTSALSVELSADTFPRFLVVGSGQHKWGSGSAATDTQLERISANRLGVTIADLSVHTLGRGLQVAEGANGKQGRTAAMTAGTITVANTSTTAASEIICTGQVLGGTAGGVNISARTAGTSFTITSTSTTDTSTVGFQMFEPG